MKTKITLSVICLSLIVVLICCTKETKPPTVETLEAIDVTNVSAIIGGNISSDGGAAISERGIFWGTSNNPHTNGTKHGIGSGAGTFIDSLSGLTPNTRYYVTAFALNSNGISYGASVSFTTQIAGGTGIIFNPNLTYGTVSDIAGNSYKTILIGTQTWMAENLRTTKLNDNTSIELVSGNPAWNAKITPAYCWYNDDISFKNPYGAMYNWYAVNTGKLCPTGWHVPTDNEWSTLTTFLGGESVAAGKMKETGTTHWTIPNTGATNESGFTSLPGGSRAGQANYGTNSMGTHDVLWSSSPISSSTSQRRYLTNSTESVTRDWSYLEDGLYVRCLKNPTSSPLIVFDNYDNIYSCNTDGSNITALTSGSAIDCRPRIDYTKTKIAFLSNRTGTWQVFTMNINGTSVQQLTTTGVSGGQNNGGSGAIDWTPDGKILYIKGNKIYKMNSDGTGSVEIATAPSNYWCDLRCSPSGNKIAAQTQGSWGYTLKIYLMNIDGTGLNLFADDLPGVQFMGNFTNDGSRLNYVYDLSGHEESSGQSLNDQIVSVKLDGTGIVNLSGAKLTGSNDLYPVYSSDGTKIFFINNIVSTGTMRIWTMNSDGTGRAELMSTSPCYDIDLK